MQPGISHIPGNWWRLLPSYQSCPKSVIAILRGKKAVAGRLCWAIGSPIRTILRSTAYCTSMHHPANRAATYHIECCTPFSLNAISTRGVQLSSLLRVHHEDIVNLATYELIISHHDISDGPV